MRIDYCKNITRSKQEHSSRNPLIQGQLIVNWHLGEMKKETHWCSQLLCPQYGLTRTKVFVNFSEFIFKPLYLHKWTGINRSRPKISHKPGEAMTATYTRLSSISVSRFRCPKEFRMVLIWKTLSTSSIAESKSSRRSAGNLSTTGISRKQLNCKRSHQKEK